MTEELLRVLDEEARRTANLGNTAPHPPLPGEGKACYVESVPQTTPPICPDPLICSNKLCVSPYR